MKRCFMVWLFLALVAGGCKPPAGPPTAAERFEQSLPTEAQPRLPTIKLYLGAQEITAEIARTERQQECGMMFRTNIPDNEGMIFLLPNQMRASFWMKNCPLPLSAAFMDPEGTILEVHDMQAEDTNSVVTAAPNILYVLETRQGWFQRHGVPVGTVVATEKGTLAKTFSRN